MLGPLLALSSGFSFTLSNIFVRRGVYRTGESYSPVVISLTVGTAIFGLWLLVSGEAGRLLSLSWLGVISLAGAGIIHLVIGRFFAATGLRLIGANRAVPIQTCFIIIAALLGVLFFGEPLTVSLVLALLLVMGGIILISTTGKSEAEKLRMSKAALPRGILAALAAAFCWGVAPILVKIGLNEVNSPVLATFISGVSAAIVIGISLFYPGNSEKLRRLTRASLLPFFVAGIAISAATILRYIALDYSPVSIVVPLTGTNTLFIFPLSFLINRQIEVFNLRIITGALAMVIGVFLIFWMV